jgi:hypothetical protein
VLPQDVVDAHVETVGGDDYRITLTLASGERRAFLGADWDEEGDPLWDGEGLRNCLYSLGVPIDVLAREVRRVAPEFDPMRDAPMLDAAAWRAHDAAVRQQRKAKFRRERDAR